VIEWTADGTDYVSRGSFMEEEFIRHWPGLRAVFLAAPHKLTRAELIDRWFGSKTPDMSTLGRWLEKGLELGLIRKDGDGLRNKPYRHWLPESEEKWRDDPLACMLMPELCTKEGAEVSGK
jgi:hypothetical protein